MSPSQVIFDFDGVLAESNQIRHEGFATLFAQRSEAELAQILAFARAHGGLSRYAKIRHFHREIFHEPLSEQRLAELAQRYSELVTQAVIEAPPVAGSLEFLAAHAGRYGFSVVSGSDQEELRRVCRARGIEKYFSHILGSPTEKDENLAWLAPRLGGVEACVYVGDSLTDLAAARANGMAFIGRASGLVRWEEQGLKGMRDLSELAERLERMRPGGAAA